MTAARKHLVSLASTAVAFAFLGSCGARTGLRLPDREFPDAVEIEDVGPDAPDAPPPQPRTYLGTEFWAVSTANGLLESGDRFHFAVAIGNPNPRSVTAHIEGGSLTPAMDVTVAANDTLTVRLPWVRALVQNSAHSLRCNDRPDSGETAKSALARHGAYHITTSEPVSMYQFNPLEFAIGDGGMCSPHSYTNDASLLLPTPALTGEYLVLAHDAFGGPGSYVAIAAAGRGTTTVTVTPRASVVAGNGVSAVRPGETVTYMLGQGDVVQLVSDGALGATDMTGSVIRASGPVAVFAGVDCTNMSWPDGSLYACDHLESQLFPEQTWGLSAVVSQLRDRAQDERYIVRILSREDGNTLTFTPPDVHPPVQLARGEFVAFESQRDFLVTGTSPLLVAQFMEGQDTVPNATMGDPAMTLEVPTEQFRRDYEFVVPASYTASFINVVGSQGAALLLDGVPITGAESIAGTNWIVARTRVRPGSHSLRTSDGSRAGLKVIGVASYTSYMYPGGLDLEAIH